MNCPVRFTSKIKYKLNTSTCYQIHDVDIQYSETILATKLPWESNYSLYNHSI